MDLDRFCRQFVEDTPDAVLYSDAEGIIRFWNAGAQRIFGFAAEEATGQSLDIIIPETLRQRHWIGYRETVRSGKSRYGAGDLLTVPALRKDGTRISVEFSIVVFRDTDRVIGIAATMRDVTKTFEQMRALRRHARGK